MVPMNPMETGNDKERKVFWIWLSLACGVASKDFGRLAAQFDNPFELYNMNVEEIERLKNIGEGTKNRLGNKSIAEAERIFSLCVKHHVQVVSYGDRQYPSRLRMIEDPPAVLYVKGSLPDMDDRLCIGVVGTRKMTEYGRNSAYRISYELADAGAVIVSGLALGIDAVSACAALSAKGSTVAVLGCGVLVDYPKAHKTLKAAIEQHGALVSEYPPDTPAQSYNFPKRNRIISGMSQGTLLVECALKSGSMITARLAIAQGRALFALPGKVGDVNAEGPNTLIREGANVALTTMDILKHYELLYRDKLSLDVLQKSRKTLQDCDRALCAYRVPVDYEKARFRGAEKTEKTKKTEKTEKHSAAPAEKRSTNAEAENAAEKRQESAPMARPTCDVPLSANEQGVLDRMPLDRPTSPDALCFEGCGIGDVLTALTMLELYGIVTSLPGGLYVRK